jgi:hypothetical protein
VLISSEAHRCQEIRPSLLRREMAAQGSHISFLKTSPALLASPHSRGYVSPREASHARGGSSALGGQAGREPGVRAKSGQKGVGAAVCGRADRASPGGGHDAGEGRPRRAGLCAALLLRSPLQVGHSMVRRPAVRWRGWAGVVCRGAPSVRLPRSFSLPPLPAPGIPSPRLRPGFPRPRSAAASGQWPPPRSGAIAAVTRTYSTSAPSCLRLLAHPAEWPPSLPR